MEGEPKPKKRKKLEKPNPDEVEIPVPRHTRKKKKVKHSQKVPDDSNAPTVMLRAKKLPSTDEREKRISLAVAMWVGEDEPLVLDQKRHKSMGALPVKVKDEVFPGIIAYSEDDNSLDRRVQQRKEMKISQAVESWASGGSGEVVSVRKKKKRG